MNAEELKAWRAELNEKFKDEFPNGIPDREFETVEGSKLGGPTYLYEAFSDHDANGYWPSVLTHIQGSVMVQGLSVPRYGLISMKSKATTIHVYGPTCKPFMKISNTGFSDGKHIFVSSLWLSRLMRDEEAADGKEHGVVPWLMHQIMHLLRNHTRRLGSFPQEVAEKAKDMGIYMDIQKAFGREYRGRPDKEHGLVFAKTLRKVESGFDPKDQEKYDGLAEETVARLMLTEQEKKQQQQNQQGGQGQPQPGQPQKGKPQQGQPGQPGAGDPADGEPQEGQGGDSQAPSQGQQGQGQPGKPQKGQGKPGKGQQGDDENRGPWDDTHSIPMEELSKVIEDNPELDGIKEALGLPDSDDIEGIGKVERESKLRDLSDIQKAMQQKAQLGGKYPGGHIVDAEAERVKADTEGKIHYKLGIRQFISGEGRQYMETYDVPGMLSYVANEDMGLGENEGVFVPEEIPAAPDAVGLVLIDTSGSVQTEMIREFLTEIMWLKRNNGEGDTASEIYVFSADTCLRGEPEPITEANFNEVIDKGVNVYGRGGTDFSTPLKQLMGSKLMKEKKVAFVLYFTDLCASIPVKSDFPAKIPVGFVCAPHDYNAEFARGVKEWANVYTIEAGSTIDLTEDGFKSGPVDKRPTRGPRK